MQNISCTIIYVTLKMEINIDLKDKIKEEVFIDEDYKIHHKQINLLEETRKFISGPRKSGYGNIKEEFLNECKINFRQMQKDIVKKEIISKDDFYKHKLKQIENIIKKEVNDDNFLKQYIDGKKDNNYMKSVHNIIIKEEVIIDENILNNTESLNTNYKDNEVQNGKYKNKSKLKNNQGLVSCGICDKTFTQKTKLISHTRIHTGERPFVCNMCGKAFNDKSNLNKHKRIHTGDRKFICNVCNIAFIRRDTLTQHKQVHMEKFRFICNICDQSFKRKESLIIHERTHTGENPHVCDRCNLSYSRVSGLKKHICRARCSFVKKKTVTSNQKKLPKTKYPKVSYECDLCNKSFSYEGNLSRHKRIHDQKSYCCVFCNKTFAQKRYLHEHNKLIHGAK